MTKNCGNCKWWSSWANNEAGNCGFPVPIYVLNKLFPDRNFLSTVTYYNFTDCNAHEMKENNKC